MHWLPASSTNGISSDTPAEPLVPKPRYAHLSSVTADRLFIIGGQDLSNVWLDDVYVYDLLGKAWVQRKNYPHHCGTYRSVAVSASQRVRLPQEEAGATNSDAILGSPGMRFRSDKSSPALQDCTSTESLTHLPYSASPTDDFPNDIYLYSNYNVRFWLIISIPRSQHATSSRMLSANSKFSFHCLTQTSLLPTVLQP